MVKMTLWYKGIRMLVPQSHPSSYPLSLSHHDIHVNGSLWYGQHLLTNPSVTLGRKYQGWQREQTGNHGISSQEKDAPSRYVTSHGNASFTRSEPQDPSIPKSSPLLSTLTKVLTAWRNAMATTKEKKQKLVQQPSKKKNKILPSSIGSNFHSSSYIYTHRNFYRILVIFHICE